MWRLGSRRLSFVLRPEILPVSQYCIIDVELSGKRLNHGWIPTARSLVRNTPMQSDDCVYNRHKAAVGL